MALRRPNRTLEIFSMSALDLFASAMGAFILVAVILFPYYLKRQEVDAENQAIRAELQAVQEALAQAEGRADKAAEKAKDKTAAASKARSAAAGAKDAVARAKAAEVRAAKAEARIAELEAAVKAAEERAEEAQRSAASARKNTKVSSVFALLGITTKAKSFVLLIDMSSSMQAYSKLMTDTVERLLRPMGPDIRLTIIGFNAPFGPARLHPWTKDGKLVAMTPKGKQQALTFSRQLSTQFAGKTPTNAALQEALRYPVEGIILLSDGAPTDNDPGTIVTEITRSNRGRMEINCVAIGDYNKAPRLVAFLQALARRNRGDFTGVSG